MQDESPVCEQIPTLNDLEREKLILEIENLRNNQSTTAKILRYIPAVSAVIAVAGFLVGLYAMNLESRRENNLREKEFKKVFWQKQVDLYSELTLSASRLATLDIGSDRQKEYQRFKELYHGPIILVMDDDVASALKDFAEKYIDYEEDPRKQVDVQEASRVLAKACANSVQQTWDIPLKKLDLKKYR